MKITVTVLNGADECACFEIEGMKSAKVIDVIEDAFTGEGWTQCDKCETYKHEAEFHVEDADDPSECDKYNWLCGKCFDNLDGDPREAHISPEPVRENPNDEYDPCSKHE